MSAQPIPVTVIGGYLGAGKTTLVNHVLRSSDERIAVIVNDFGEISIDEDLIVAADSDKLTLANGCICCTLADGFAAALMQIRSAGTLPQRLLIEASGVADPAQIAAYGHTPGLRLDAVVVLADAEQIRRQADDRWVADTVRRQLATADLLVLNKIDLLPRDGERAGTDSSTALSDWLRTVASQAAVIGARRAAVPLDVLFGTRHPEAAGHAPSDGSTDRAFIGRTQVPPDAAEQAQPGPGPEPLPDALELFDSQTVELDAPVAELLITALLADLPDSVVRLKGLLQVAADASRGSGPDDPADFLIEAVGARTSMTPRQADTIASSTRRAVSIITHKDTLPPTWLRDQLQP